MRNLEQIRRKIGSALTAQGLASALPILQVVASMQSH